MRRVGDADSLFERTLYSVSGQKIAQGFQCIIYVVQKSLNIVSISTQVPIFEFVEFWGSFTGRLSLIRMITEDVCRLKTYEYLERLSGM